MTSFADDIIAGDELIILEYQRLEGHVPTHELVRYISLTSDKRGFTPTQDRSLQRKFLEQFTDEKTTVARMWINYYVAMRKAVDKIEGIDRGPHERKRMTLSPSELAANPIYDDLPF
ncbi:MAG: hypothetical protein KJ905_00235 [Nanoarchaeota archaeon]|nr:hypothetical protein [Nanoarchaeota archaeon]MBU1501188.1 hypothetical protein [Nanoarchaeota archaeon]MBU2459329.1 hypothetical protein [Nanoarchaeota archaeon]